MPPKKGATKRKAEKNDPDTDEEIVSTSSSTSKRGRVINPSKANEPELKFDLQWYSYGDDVGKNIPALYYLYTDKLPACKKIAAFDIDNTIINTKSGKNFAINAKDWQWFDKCVPEKLKELHESGYRVTFITNQAGIEKGKSSFAELKTKFQDMLSQLDIPIFILISTGETHYRKPSDEMWKFFLKTCNKDEPVDIKECYYVGDAAGRAKNWAPGKPKDFSCSDRMFAHNSGIGFYTPEEFFLKQKSVPFEWGSINPLDVLKKHENKKEEKEPEYHSKDQEIILLCGPPASGKSTFYRRFLAKHNYVHVNRDTLQTPAKCLKASEEGLSAGKSVCIDNTNPSPRVRAEYINLAKKHKVPIRCIIMNTDMELCHHLNYVRQNQTKSKVRRIPDVGYNMFKKDYAKPDVKEGFSEVLTVDFVPKFESTEDETIFKHWTT